jgi:hypothetical protein
MNNRNRRVSRGNVQRGPGPRLSNAPPSRGPESAGSARASYGRTPEPPSVAPSEDFAVPGEPTENPTPSSPIVFDDTILSKPEGPLLKTLVPPSFSATVREAPPPPASSRDEAQEFGTAIQGQRRNSERAERRSRSRGKGARSAAPSEPALGVSPPVTAASGADLDETFFEEGVKSDRGKTRLDAALAHEELVHDDDAVTDLKLLHKMQPEVRARRARYARYVTVVGAGCMLLALAALVKHKIARGDQEIAARDMAAYAAAHAPGSSPMETAASPGVSIPAPPPEPGLPASAAAGAPPSPDPSSADIPAAASSVAVGDKVGAKPSEDKVGAPAASAPPSDTESPHAKTAAQEKRDCQVLLDRGAFGKAIEAGQRSVGLDPTDGEAWLLLGAAYQSQGRMGEARRAFSACVKQGRKGPLGECKAMLQ